MNTGSCRRKFAIAFFTAAAVVLFFAIFYRRILLEFVCGSGFYGKRERDTLVQIGTQIFPVRAYRVLLPKRDLPLREKVLFLVAMPYRGSGSATEYVNLKIGRGYIAVFNDFPDLFIPTRFGLFAGENIATGYSLDDDMKGWGASYQIRDEGTHIFYDIAPSADVPERIRFQIPRQWLEDPARRVLP